jgi:hypothetical protein
MKRQPKKVDHSKMKSGKLPPKKDARTFKLSSYLKGKELPPVPEKCNWGTKIKPTKWGMMHNKDIEICTCAAAGHFIMAWTSNTGKVIEPNDISIIEAYSAITGFDPKTRKNDIGAYLMEVLKYWRKYYIGGHRIYAFAKLRLKNVLQLKQSVYLFGGAYVGLRLPKSAQRQHIWKVPPQGIKGEGAKGSWTGHCVLVTGYSESGLRIITWGHEKIMEWDFWKTYSDESYAIFSEDFIKDNKNPAGIDLKAIKLDIKSLKKRNK